MQVKWVFIWKTGDSGKWLDFRLKNVLLDINQLAGSAAFGRFCQTALWLEHINETHGNIKTQMGTIPADYNRILHILKARNSIGQGTRLACHFYRDDLRLKELGMIVRTKQRLSESA